MLQCKSFSFIKIPKYVFFKKKKKGQPAAIWKNTTRSHNPEDKIALKIVLMSQPEKKNISTHHPSLCLSIHSSINLANNNQEPLACPTPSWCGGQCLAPVLKKYTDSCEWRQVNKCNAMIVIARHLAAHCHCCCSVTKSCPTLLPPHGL